MSNAHYILYTQYRRSFALVQGEIPRNVSVKPEPLASKCLKIVYVDEKLLYPHLNTYNSDNHHFRY